MNENKLEETVCKNFCCSNNVVRHITQSLESINNGVLLSNLSYEEVPIENDSVIYCDPPYKNTNTYLDEFNHEKFYEWLRDYRKKNQQVFISEYQMPDDFFEVYYTERHEIMSTNRIPTKLKNCIQL